jgi:DNA-binding PadR family transcriptional regulator
MTVSKMEVTTLGLLAEGPLYGYELLERFRDRGMGLWAEAARASVYQALRRLEDRGLATGRPQQGKDGPDRRVYRITATGRTRLRAGLRERFAEPGPYDSDANLAYGFTHLLTADEVRHGLEERRAARAALRVAIAEERSRTVNDGGAARRVALRVLELQDSLARAEEGWLASFTRDLTTLRQPS